MPKLLQINECLNLSTGKIAQYIGDLAVERGWDSWIAYSGREPFSPSKSKTIKIGSFINSCIHFLFHRIFDIEGLCSSYQTKKLIKKIDDIHPDVIHLHNIHDHWLNYELLFKFIIKSKIPVVWTHHDCWAFTGGCMYFDLHNCHQWKTGCKSCQDKRALFLRAPQNLKLKSQLIKKIDKLFMVSVSNWIGQSIKQSLVNGKNNIVIHNGIDTEIFYPKFSKLNDGKFRILGVASTWDKRKGLKDFIALRRLLPNDFVITLVGLTENQIKELPSGITGIKKTDSVEELVKHYCESDVFINTSYSDNFPTVNLEALACGTPVITYDTGGSAEAIDKKTGIVVDQGNIQSLVRSIYSIKQNPFSPQECRSRVINNFEKNMCFEKYIQLYNSIL